MQKISLVTGGAGFIGSHLVDRLLNLNHRVIVIDNESSDGHDDYYWNGESSNHKIDICDYGAMRHIFQFHNIDYVYHLAAKVSVQESVEFPLPTFITNALGTANILELSRVFGVERFIYSSTSAVYGESNPVPSLEDMKEDPQNAYAIGKMSGEQLVRSYNRLYGMKTATFRYTNVYGNRSRHTGTYAPVVTRFIDRHREGKPLLIFGDGEQRRDFIHVSDVVSANAAISYTNLDTWGETYNIGYGKNWSINELAEKISPNVEYLPAREGEMRETLADISKVKKNLTWKPKIDMMDWISTKV